ncbi:hypothetical protein VTO42DRAFT_8310 [Malbranchea cinnamomea]
MRVLMGHWRSSLPTIYIIGAQCTGKTTFVNALSKYLGTPENHRRSALWNYRLIFYAQYRAKKVTEGAWYISDRSAIVPLVYAKVFVGERAAHEMIEADIWIPLQDKMRNGLVFVCEPNPAWLADDGVRLMPADWEDWIDLHQVFCQTLEEHGIVFAVLSGSLSVVERLDSVVKSMLHLEKMEDVRQPNTKF